MRELDIRQPRDVRAFIAFPFDLYDEDPNWVPPLVSEMETALDRDEHPFYRHSTAAFFVVESADQILGRVAVLDNRNYNRFHRTAVGFFCYFEVVPEMQAAEALLNTAADWARGRGLDTLMGPKGLLQGDGLGLLVDGFEHRPALGMTYNPPYYDAFLTSIGFGKETDYLSGVLHAGYDLPERFYRLAERVKSRRGLWIKTFSNRGEMRAWVPHIHKIYNQAFTEVWGYCPVTEAEIQMIAERLISVANPRLIKLVMKEEEVIGFVFAYPDVTAALQRSGGRLWPFGWVHFLLEARRTKWVNLNGVGLLPGHQGVGANAVLYTELAKSIKSFRFEHADVAQINENNRKSMGDMEAIGLEWYKTHRVYRLAL